MLQGKTGKRTLFKFLIRSYTDLIIYHIRHRAEVLSERLNCAYLALTDYLRFMKFGLGLMMKFL